jgi:hypothetical protein
LVPLFAFYFRFFEVFRLLGVSLPPPSPFVLFVCNAELLGRLESLFETPPLMLESLPATELDDTIVLALPFCADDLMAPETLLNVDAVEERTEVPLNAFDCTSFIVVALWRRCAEDARITVEWVADCLEFSA